MWIMPLHLHVNQKSDYDMIFMGFSNEKMVQRQSLGYNKQVVNFRHMIRCFYLHYVVLCLASVKINTLLAYFYGI